MTDDFNTDHLPPDAVTITPIQAQVGRGYESTTGLDFISLSILDHRRGAFTILLKPALARDIADEITRMCDALDNITPTGEHR
ncbi:hypothetical protein CRM90_28450 [Mycobacterium sp. ENV421]|uniref:hypothetical protein n=1 Tax=Mycobacterium sp. ENV421 TaxID=1213407 RepID=UPI000C9B25F8|nr:hypothetical protein [Mycobacterium sp. ENV421]PND54346.1 hypothetical protein CRM90_28450 [Mycobacterium sp. ENV421]